MILTRARHEGVAGAERAVCRAEQPAAAVTPLLRRAPLRALRSGGWGALTVAALMLLSAAAASGPVLDAVTANAALRDQLAAVPGGAPASSAAVVRVVGGAGAQGRGVLATALDDVPGLGEATTTASSIGREQIDRQIPFTPYVSAGTGDGERARLFGDDLVATDPAKVLAVTSRAAAASAPAVWLPDPVARRLGVTAGRVVTIGVRRRDESSAVRVTVAGTYAVQRDGRTPTDPLGSTRWALRGSSVPPDSQLGTLRAFLLVTDVTTAGTLARQTGDTLLFAVEAQPSPAVPTLEQADATVAAIRRLQQQVRDPAIVGDTPDRLRAQVVTGLPGLVGDASAVAARTVAWTSTLAAAGVALGLLAVLAAALLGTGRRRRELELTAALGIRPATTGALAAAEMVLPALLGAVLGTALATVVVRVAGPPGALPASAVLDGGVRAVLAAAVGVLLVAIWTALAAARAARLVAAERRPRPWPWEAGLALVAVTAAGALLTRPDGTGPPGPVDLLVPLLVITATAALGTRLVLALARRRTPRPWGRHPALTLAVRRLVAGGDVLVVTALATGLGLLVYAVAAAGSLRQVADDRADVRAGAAATAEVEVSWLLDPGAAQLPQNPSGEGAALLGQRTLPVPGTRTPPLPAGTTIVWRGRTTVPPEFGNVDLLVVDPARFDAVARWGSGPELAAARRALRQLRTADRTTTQQVRDAAEDVVIPVIAVGDVLQRRGDRAAFTTLQGDIPVRVLDRVDAFPGTGSIGMLVVPADALFSYLGEGDPRVRPPERSGRFNRLPPEFYPSLWSATGPDALTAITTAADVDPGATTTYAQLSQQPDLVAARRAGGLLVALGLVVAALGVVGLSLAADRATQRALAADVLLERLGLGRRGTRRARTLQLAATCLLATGLAAVGVALVRPLGSRLLDPGGGESPAFALRFGVAPVLAAVVTLVVALALGALVAARRAATAHPSEVLRDE